jgi:hypothetical protein
VGNTTSTSYASSGLSNSTTYYWKIVAKNSCGNSTSGPVWHFSTVQPNTYTLTVTKSGTGSGTVTSSPAGINCGTNCTENVKPGKKITLKAKADSNSLFTGWSGGGYSGTGTRVVVMNADTAVTAAFSTKVPAISVSPSSLDFGSVKIKRSLKKILKIANNGTGDLKITLEGPAGSDFIIAGSTSVTVKPNKTYNLSITFKPSSAGNKTAILTVNSNDPNAQTVSVPLSGMGM